MSTPTTPPEQPVPTKFTKCQICEREFKKPQGLISHASRTHKISKEDYYKIYINTDPDAGKCLTCGGQTNFVAVTTGYYVFCSIACNNKNPELARQRSNNHIKTMEKDPTIREKATAKQMRTLEENPEIKLNANAKVKQTLKENPDIITNRIGKFKETHRKDPSILEKRSKKFKATLAADPSIQIEMNKKQSEAVAKDPSITTRRLATRQQTLKENPDILLEAAKKQKETKSTPEWKEKIHKILSIARRDYYNRLRQSDGTMPCTIYLLAHSSLDIVKIGITSDFEKRMKLLRYHFGPMKEIKIVKTTHAIASTLEIEMHEHFKEHCSVQPHGGGRTEFYLNTITDEAIVMLEEIEPSSQV